MHKLNNSIDLYRQNLPSQGHIRSSSWPNTRWRAIADDDRWEDMVVIRPSTFGWALASKCPTRIRRDTPLASEKLWIDDHATWQAREDIPETAAGVK